MSKQKIACHGCGVELKSGDKAAKYTAGNINFYKCPNCYGKNGELNNFQDCDVYTRVVGFYTPVSRWHKGKRAEYKDRKTFIAECASCR